MSLALHSVSHALKSMWNASVGIKNCKQLFLLRLAFTTQKKQHIQRRWCPYYVLLFFGLYMQAVVKKVAYSFRYRPGPGKVGREVFHIVSRVNTTFLCWDQYPTRGDMRRRKAAIWTWLSTRLKARLITNGRTTSLGLVGCTGFVELEWFV